MKNNNVLYTNLAFSFYDFESKLNNLCADLPFGLQHDNSGVNLSQKENGENDGFYVCLFRLHISTSQKGFEALFAKANKTFGYYNPITIVLQHDYSNGGFALQFKSAHYISKQGEVIVCNDLQSLINNLKKIIA